MIDYKALFESMQIIDEYLTEKVQWKRNLNSLLRKYNYNPNNETIKYNGNVYNIKIDRDRATSSQVHANVEDTQKKTGSFEKSHTIYLNPDDFRTNSIDDMETTLLHEIGHTKVNNDTKTLDYKTIQNNISSEEKFPENGNKFTKYAKYNKLSDDQKKLLLTKMKSKKDLSKDEKGLLERNKFANNIENLSNQRNKNQSYHSNQSEYEADRYAADHLPNGTNRVSKMIKNTYDNDSKNLKSNMTKAVISSDFRLSDYNEQKSLENFIDYVKRSNLKKIKIDGIIYSRDDGLKLLSNMYHDKKMNKHTLKQGKYIRDSLKDKNSPLSKEIDKLVTDDKVTTKNDIVSRKKALAASKYSDTKSFTTIDDKGTKTDKDNRTVTKNNKSQRNIMAKQ